MVNFREKYGAWLNEHRAAVKRYKQKNGIAVRALKAGHKVKWEASLVKEVVGELSMRRIMAALCIHQTPRTTRVAMYASPPHLTSK